MHTVIVRAKGSMSCNTDWRSNHAQLSLRAVWDLGQAHLFLKVPIQSCVLERLYICDYEGCNGPDSSSTQYVLWQQARGLRVGLLCAVQEVSNQKTVTSTGLTE